MLAKFLFYIIILAKNLIFKTEDNVSYKEKIWIFFRILKATEERSRILSWIRIHKSEDPHQNVADLQHWSETSLYLHHMCNFQNPISVNLFFQIRRVDTSESFFSSGAPRTMGIVEEELGMFFSVQMVLFSFNLLPGIYWQSLALLEKHDVSC